MEKISTYNIISSNNQNQCEIQMLKCQLHPQEFVKRVCILKSCEHYMQPVCLECAFMFHDHSTGQIIPIQDFENQLVKQVEDVDVNTENEEVNQDLLQNLMKIKKQMKIFSDQFEEAEKQIKELSLQFCKIQKEDYPKVEAKQIQIDLKTNSKYENLIKGYQNLSKLIEKVEIKPQINGSKQQTFQLVFKNQFSKNSIRSKEQEIQYRQNIITSCEKIIEQQTQNLKNLTTIYENFQKENFQNDNFKIKNTNCVCHDIIKVQNEGCQFCNIPPNIQVLDIRIPHQNNNNHVNRNMMYPPPPPPPISSIPSQQVPQMPPPLNSIVVPNHNSQIGRNNSNRSNLINLPYRRVQQQQQQQQNARRGLFDDSDSY